jgi:hypothetical protein
MTINNLTGEIIGAAIEVRKALGPGLLELKSVDSLQTIHEAQLLTYLKLISLKVGLLINFNVPALREGIRRLVI